MKLVKGVQYVKVLASGLIYQATPALLNRPGIVAFVHDGSDVAKVEISVDQKPQNLNEIKRPPTTTIKLPPLE
jgi:hypothetical protein